MSAARRAPAVSLKFCALDYLNAWCRNDKRFFEALSGAKSSDDIARLRCLRDVANDYRIARNFKTLARERRLAAALRALDAVTVRITESNVVSSVDDLAKTFKRTYGTRSISAASKFLWFKFRSPVVIYDSRAREYLNRKCRPKIAGSDYKKYRTEWLRQFANCRDDIRSACTELRRVKDFSPAADISDGKFSSLVGAKWFHERVFDKFLWWNGGVKDSVEVQTLP